MLKFILQKNDNKLDSASNCGHDTVKISDMEVLSCLSSVQTRNQKEKTAMHYFSSIHGLSYYVAEKRGYDVDHEHTSFLQCLGLMLSVNTSTHIYVSCDIPRRRSQQGKSNLLPASDYQF